MIQKILQIFGVEIFRVSHAERLVSMAGAFSGILAVFLISTYFMGETGGMILVASMGASAVLLFAVPLGTLSQPWALVGGHLVSAAIGVTCAKYIPNAYIAAPLAVGLAVGAMHYLHCIHPPGGATALAATIGGAEVTTLGYSFIVTPVLINVIVILSIAIIFNYFFDWRRYPVYLHRKKSGVSPSDNEELTDTIAREDFVYALSEIDSYIDVSESDLVAIYNLVIQHRTGRHIDQAEIELGHYYSNGKIAGQQEVRQIVDWSGEPSSGERKIIYKVMHGANRRSSAVVTADQFARWAKYEVKRDGQVWRPVISS